MSRVYCDQEVVFKIRSCKKLANYKVKRHYTYLEGTGIHFVCRVHLRDSEDEVLENYFHKGYEGDGLK